MSLCQQKFSTKCVCEQNKFRKILDNKVTRFQFFHISKENSVKHFAFIFQTFSHLSLSTIKCCLTLTSAKSHDGTVTYSCCAHKIVSFFYFPCAYFFHFISHLLFICQFSLSEKLKLSF